jgi:hypothetical protein
MKRLAYAGAMFGAGLVQQVSENAERMAHVDPTANVNVIICSAAAFTIMVIATYFRAKDAGYTSKWATLGFMLPFGAFILMFLPTGYRTRQLAQQAITKAVDPQAPQFDLGAAYRKA